MNENHYASPMVHESSGPIVRRSVTWGVVTLLDVSFAGAVSVAGHFEDNSFYRAIGMLMAVAGGLLMSKCYREVRAETRNQ